MTLAAEYAVREFLTDSLGGLYEWFCLKIGFETLVSLSFSSRALSQYSSKMTCRSWPSLQSSECDSCSSRFVKLARSTYPRSTTSSLSGFLSRAVASGRRESKKTPPKESFERRFRNSGGQNP